MVRNAHVSSGGLIALHPPDSLRGLVRVAHFLGASPAFHPLSGGPFFQAASYRTIVQSQVILRNY
jgi:hypothetical protein